jgi:hypothetical protein
MAIRGKPVKVLRLWHRMSLMPEVKELSHGAFRWLYALTMSWSGINNGALTFTQQRHGKDYRLAHPEVFERARDEVIATGLVLVVRRGGKNQPAQYALALVPIQVPIATESVVTPAKILTTESVVIDAKTATDSVVSCYGIRSKKTASYKGSRARPNGNAISNVHATSLTESHGDTAAKTDARQRAELEAQARTTAINGTTWQASSACAKTENQSG